MMSIVEWVKNKIRYRMYPGDVRRMIRANKIPDVDVSLARLAQAGFKPGLIFDVGAYHGEFSASCLRLWPDARIVAFEALPDKIEGLNKKFAGRQVEVVQCIVGDKDLEDFTFFADENASSAQFSEEVNTRKKQIHGSMIRLDSYIDKVGTGIPDLLQLDTLAFEYEILNGMGDKIKGVGCILLQVNFLEIYHDVKLAHHVIKYLADHGFVIFDVGDIHRRPLDNALWQMDLLFVKESSALRSDKRWG
jgi:FkbM family methyltransferase